MSNEQTLEALPPEGAERERIIYQIYQDHLSMVDRLNRRHGILNREEVLEAYNDGLVDLIQRIKQSQFHLKKKMAAYFWGIVNNKCIERINHKRTQRQTFLDKLLCLEDRYHGQFICVPSFLEEFLEKEREERLIQLMHEQVKALPPRQQSILKDVYFHNYSMDQIAEKYQLKNRATAKSVKYNCLQKLKRNIYQELMRRGY